MSSVPWVPCKDQEFRCRSCSWNPLRIRENPGLCEGGCRIHYHHCGGGHPHSQLSHPTGRQTMVYFVVVVVISKSGKNPGSPPPALGTPFLSTSSLAAHPHPCHLSPPPPAAAVPSWWSVHIPEQLLPYSSWSQQGTTVAAASGSFSLPVPQVFSASPETRLGGMNLPIAANVIHFWG